MMERPLPFSVRATSTDGLPFVARASANAACTAAMSWPSTTMACQPNAFQRAATLSASCPNCVSRLWPSPLRSMMAHSESTWWNCPLCAASHTEPSAISPSPSITYVR